MIDLYKEIDFTQQLEQQNQVKHFLHQACKKIEEQEAEHLRKIKKPELDDQLNNQFIVCGIPTLKPQNADKFLTLFKTKLLNSKNIGEKNGLVDINPGMDNNVGNGTLFMTYHTSTEAKAAYYKLNNLKFDANHRMSCVWVSELRTIIEEEEGPSSGAQFKEPVLTTSKDRIDHNQDPEFRSQFLFREDKLVYLQLLDHLDKSAASALSSEYLSLGHQVNKMVFSPRGSYLAICTNEGVHLYVGNSLKYKGLLRQAGSIDAKFSYDERFVVTSNGNLRKNRENFIIWAVEEEIKIKSYRAQRGQNMEAFEFSQDNENLAICLGHEVTFYKLTTVEDLRKQIRAPEEEQHIIKANFVQKIAWLKSKNDIIVMCYEPDYNPMSAAATRIFLYNCETKVQRKWRAWGEHAKNGQIFVSEKGEWVAIALRKFIKKGHFATSIQIGNLVRKEQPIEISSIELKEDVGNISIDSNNNRMAVIHKDQTFKSINVRYIVSFYELSMKQKSLEIIKIASIANNLQNRVVLASNGCFFALYNINEDSAERGRFSLGMIAKETKDKGKKHLNFEFTKQNLMVNGMNFFNVDPSGRFILLGTQKGYQVWNFIGEIVTKDTLQKNIHDVQWRPRLFNRLPEAEEKKLIEQEKQIRKKYELIDDKRINALKYAKLEAMQKQKEQFFKFIAAKKAWFKGFAQKRENILGFKQIEVRTDKYEVQQNFIDLQ